MLKKIRARVIESVRVIHQGFKGPDVYTVGDIYEDKYIADIIESNGTIWLFDEDEEIIMEIRNCPVVISYKNEE